MTIQKPNSVGKPITRVDGRYKVTGQAKYAGDFPLKNLTYAALIQSTIASGTITSVDASEAEKHPGVLKVITHLNGAKLDSSKTSPFDWDLPLMQGPDISHDRQNIGVVIAESIEAATEGAALVKIKYATKTPVLDFWEESADARAIAPPDNKNNHMFADTSRGDFETAYKNAAIKIDVSYSTPKESHNPMEPHATTAVWNGGKLTVYDSTQGIFGCQQKLAKVFNIPATDVHVITKFVGGGFGCKGTPWSHVPIAALAAKEVGRPVRLVLDRNEMYGSVGWRPATKQNYKLGADSKGKLVALKLDGIIETCQYDQFVEYVGNPARFLYDCDNVITTHRLIRQDIGKPTFMRAPGAVTGTYSLGCIMDELAYAANVDPLELRLINYSEKEGESGKPYSSKHLKECYSRGAELFGWSKRNPKPKSMSKDGALIGMGMATATYPAHQFPGSAKVILKNDGTAIVESGSQDIGTGTYTIMTQIAADALGLPFEKVTFRLGDTNYPFASVSGGSTTAVSVGNAIESAAKTAMDQMITLAAEDSNSKLHGLDKAKISYANGKLFNTEDETQSESFVDVLKRSSKTEISAEGKNDPHQGADKFALHSFGAQFAEVKVDPDLRTIRVTRFVGVYDGGRILNAKTARSQFLGGVVMGIGMALQEQTILDGLTGRTLNADLAEYHVPVHADMPEISVEWLDHPDTNFSPIGARGIGEIGITGVAAAIANAVYHATGIRVRELPITMDKILT
ncbi:MAG TPA: xanthine dehydrogenase family protein molybdopterin-binding subunit [Drouetiella sp.]